MLKSYEQEKLWRYSNYWSPNSKEFTEVISADPPFLFTIFSRIGLGGPGIRYQLPGRCDGSKLMDLMLH